MAKASICSTTSSAQIALARAANADAIVSRDGHLTQLDDPTPPVLTPRQFVERLT
jgi:predicted nucleic acid-binding protein